MAESPTNQEPELPNRKQSWQFSLASLSLLTLAFGATFALSNWIGGYGVSIGVLLIWAAVGRMGGRRNWQFGGLSSALIIVIVLMFSWLDSGTVAGVVGNEIEHLEWRMEGIDKLITHYKEINGVYPDSYDDLTGAKGIPGVSVDAVQRDAAGTELIRAGSTRQIVFLGRDGKVGGVGLDADCQFGALDEYRDRRIPIDQFLFDQHGNPRIKMLSIFGLIIGLSTSQLFAKVPGAKRSWRFIAALFAFSVVAIVVGVMMAGLHLVLGQGSGH